MKTLKTYKKVQDKNKRGQQKINTINIYKKNQGENANGKNYIKNNKNRS